MKFIPIISIFLGISSCSHDQSPIIFSGSVEGTTIENTIIEPLKNCYCWQTPDSINFSMASEKYAGIAVLVTIKNNVPSPSIEYYSDTNEYDGESSLQVPIQKDSLVVTIKTVGDSLYVSGYFDLSTEPVELYGKGGIISAKGSFNCNLNRYK